MNSVEQKTYQPLYLIQRLQMRSKDNQVPFSDRFTLEYMGSAEFEQGNLARRIREMADNCLVGELMADGCPILAAWNPDRFTKREAEREINRIYHGEQRTKEWTNFDQKYRRARERTNDTLGARQTNAWFDITNGLFWTWVPCNISDIRKNFKLSKDKMDGIYVPKSKAVEPPAPIDPLRQRLLDSGQLRPNTGN